VDRNEQASSICNELVAIIAAEASANLPLWLQQLLT
jgi:hypothetical protein